MSNRNPYTLKLILMIAFSFFMVFIFIYFSSNKNLSMNLEANDIYIHKLTIGNTCMSSYIDKLRFENIKITYNTLDRLENKCK